MFKTNEVYEKIEIDGKNIDLKNTPTDELKKYLEILNEKEMKLIEKQNEYLSQILS